MHRSSHAAGRLVRPALILVVIASWLFIPTYSSSLLNEPVLASNASTSSAANSAFASPAAALDPLCSYCIFPTGKSFSSDVGIGNISVITQSGCSWTATANDGFITITAGNGTGNGVVSYNVAPNPSNSSRTGTISIAGQTYTITQDRACTTRPSNLVSWWPGEGNASDISGANPGTLEGGVSFVPGKVGKAFRFNGTNGAVTINDSVSIKSANITVEAWVSFDALDSAASTPGLQYIIFKKNSRSSPFEGYSLYKTRVGGQDHLNFTISSAAGTQIVTTSTTLVTTGQFYHLAGTYDGSSVKLYVNGALESQQAASFPLDYDTTPLFFGTSGDGSLDGKLRGLLDEVSIYDRALTASEIDSIHDADSGGKCKEVDFADVAPSNIFYASIRRLSALGVTRGCGGGNYCPSQPVLRDQMAAFIIRALGNFTPPTPAQQRFADVPPSNPFYAFIDQMAQLGITVGCGGGNYCPNQPVTRDQMAAFIIRALGVSNPPPPAQQRFADVPPSNVFYAFIEEMAVRRITLGCAAGTYCPGDPVTREQMAAFLTRAFDTQINRSPVAFAGGNQTITLPGNANLSGSANDDGFPGCGALVVNWSKVSGPGSVTFGTPNSLLTTAGFDAPGTYVLRLTVSDLQLSGFSELTVTVNPVNPNNQPPQVNAGPNQTITLPDIATLNGTASDDGNPPGSTLKVSWSKISGPAPVIFSNASATTSTATFSTPGNYVLRLTANDSELSNNAEVTITVNGDTTPPPPDPSLVAPPIDPTVVTTIGAATQFLYTGPNPIQTGVAPGTISMVRAAVLRGRVVDHNGSPLSLVRVTVVDHPEFGQTLSRADGRFDLAVNGGGVLIVQYEKVGLIASQRKMDIRWQDFQPYPEVMLMGYDSQVTHIDLSASLPVQIAQGSTSSDDDGARRSTLLFMQGTTATMVLPNNSTQPLTNLHVRATEFTVGDMGSEAMPGDLPATSGYTYAVEFSADEAVAAGAKSIVFNQPVINYLENFLDFAVGVNIPSGSYDRESGYWVPSPSGRVVKILTVSGGSANLDIDGSGLPASDPDYAALGITIVERQRVATLYTVGQVLWRVPIVHFSSLDFNWGEPAPEGVGVNQGKASSDKPDPCQEVVRRSIIECQSQTLGESIRIVGTPFTLNYRSNRVPGRTAAYALSIPVSLATVPANLKRIDLEIMVSGRAFSQTFSNATNQTTNFTWDGKDAYGRILQGKQLVTVRVGYVFNGGYAGTPFFGDYGDGTSVNADLARHEVTLWQEQRLSVGTFDTRGLGLGGWSFDEHHVYDPNGQTIYMGDGTQRNIASVSRVISTFAGGGTPPDDVGDGLPATQAKLSQPEGGIVASPDGALYIADSLHHRIRRIGTDGIISTVAGTGTAGYNGDGIQATQAQLNRPAGLALSTDGSLLISDTLNHRVRKVAPSGIITTVAGTGNGGYSGDDGPATQAELNQPRSLAFAPDGSTYLIDSFNFAVRRVSPSGIITTIGQGHPARPAANRPAVNVPSSVTVGPDGALYLADTGAIYRINQDRSEVIIAGGGNPADGLGDGLPATQARTSAVAFAFAPDGSLYLVEVARVRAVGPDGIITTVAGHGSFGLSGDGNPAPQADLNGPGDVAVGRDGALYIVDTFNHRVRKITPPMPGFSSTDIAVASEDGGELYQFNSVGKHLRTINTLTNATLYSFTYDSAGRLSQVADGDNNVTSVQRNSSGDPTAIAAPFGQHTTLTLDSNGFINNITDPASLAYQMSYTTGGLLTSLTNPRGNVSTFTYESNGRLKKDTDASMGFMALARTEQSQAYTVALTTSVNRTSNYQVQTLATGDMKNINTDIAGLQTQALRRASGMNTITSPDGTIETSTESGDPRWGMQASIVASATVSTPGNLNFNATFARALTLSNPADVLSLSTQTDTINVNGRTYTRQFNAATRTFIDTTPASRQLTSTIDAQGRLTHRQFADLNAGNYSYDSRGRLSTVIIGAGDEARSSSFSYNSSGFRASVTDPLGRVTNFIQDAAGRTTEQTSPDTRIIGFGYDANGNLTSITPPGRPAHTFGYNAVDRRSLYTPPAVAGTGPTQYVYDLDRQLTTITRPDSLTLSFGYDTTGRLNTLTIPTGLYSYAYSPTTGNVTSVTAPGSNTLTYGYDGSLLTGTTWSGVVSGNVSRVFDNNFRISSQSVNSGSAITFTYDDDSLLTGAGDLVLSRSAQNGLITGTTLGDVNDTRGYDNFGEPASYSSSFNATDLYSLTCTRDKLGRITQKSETIGGVTNVYDYSYDLAGRLMEVKVNNITVSSYTFDSNDNRLTYTGPGGTVNGAYDNQDRLTQYGTTTYSYTANGELSSKTTGAQTTAYSYDVLGNLRSVTLPNGTQIDYLIDGQNRRVGKNINGVLIKGWLYQDQLRPVAELDGSSNLVSRFVYGGPGYVPDYMIKGGVTYRIITDHVGSVRLVVDVATGAIAQQLDYDEFGVVTMDSNPGFQPFGFAGGLYDPQTKLTRFGARDYDAEIGRWTAKDPILFAGGDTNLYAYAANDPINLIDPWGTDLINYAQLARDLFGLNPGSNNSGSSGGGGIDPSKIRQIDPNVDEGENLMGTYSDTGPIINAELIRFLRPKPKCPTDEQLKKYMELSKGMLRKKPELLRTERGKELLEEIRDFDDQLRRRHSPPPLLIPGFGHTGLGAINALGLIK